MRFWHYISEFFLFRWLFGTHGRSGNKYYADESSWHRFDTDSCIRDEESCQSYDDFLEEQEDYDMMDDF